MPPARDRRLSKGRPEVVLKATQSVRNNIPYNFALPYKTTLILITILLLTLYILAAPLYYI